MDNCIVIKGARQHNLKNIDVVIPRGKMVVITGLSGSGKSSLAIDTLYAEGQRRYVESLSAYARQFLGQMDKPDVDFVEGLSPAICIDQRSGSRNPRSTVGTVTEIYDYLRLLYARVGHPHCPVCGRAISKLEVDQIVDQVLQLPEGTRAMVLAPLVRGRKGEHGRVIEDIRRAGYVRARVDGTVVEIENLAAPKLDKNKKHTIEAVVDRIVVRPGARSRISEDVEAAIKLSGGLVVISADGQDDIVLSQNLACPECGVSIAELSPRMFSFNSPYGACPECDGLGFKMVVDEDKVIPDKGKSLSEGAIEPWSKPTTDYYNQLLRCVCEHYGIDMNKPVRELPPEQLNVILYGSGAELIRFNYVSRYGRSSTGFVRFEGVINSLQRHYAESTSEAVREEIQEYMSSLECPCCHGARLKPESLAVKVGGISISQFTAMSVLKAREFLRSLELTEKERLIARQILSELDKRLGFLVDVGLDYLTLDRSAGSLAGGEAQRIHLATQIGSGLVGVLYVLDEPSVGLHQRDNRRLLNTLKRLRDLGNTLVVVEHDEETIREADWIIDMGPGAGEHGGEVVAEGTVEQIEACERSITGSYLSGRRRIEVPPTRRRPGGQWLRVIGAKEHNLKNVDVSIPLGLFVCVTGVSGSGKSTLVNEIVYRKLANVLNGAKLKAGRHEAIEGIEHLRKVIDIDQSPIGRTPRSNPATYTGTFDLIRRVFAETSEARARGYAPGRFSFNVRGGRCEACHGDGIIKIEMHFLPDVYVPCEVCKGKRYNRETLEVRYKGRNIAEVLDMTVEEALNFFENVEGIKRRLQTLYDVGLGYIRLGQPATQLSGGEAQRVKLATELSRRSNGGTLYILDEPTTGLHMEDVRRLLEVLQRLVESGSTVLVIEHNLDVIKCADYVIDLGPEGGEGGGQVVACGTPEEIARVPESHTGRFLAEVLARDRDAAGLAG
ncbi:MAG TPA: excinuclease ABC subunit UvrA [Firmicutes bacterium]|nr:excinuclease ABC subunit UvrA [Bacillota bacterium]